MAQTISVGAGQTSAPFYFAGGATITVNPGSGGSALVEYTTGTDVDIRNGVAIWTPWRYGTVTAQANQPVTKGCWVRVTAYTAQASFVLGDTNDIYKSIATKQFGERPREQHSKTNVFLGNSLTALGGPFQTASLAPQPDYSWLAWAKTFSGNRMRHLNNAGISGDTYAKLISRLDQDVWAYNPDYVTVLEGTNSISVSGLATANQDAQTLVMKLLERGVIVILCTCPPRNAVTSGTVLQRNQDHEAHNDVLRNLALKYPNIWLVDIWAAMVDPTSATMSAKTNYLGSDNLHPAAKGARAMGQAWANVVNARVPDNTIFYPTTNYNNRPNNAAARNMMPNPLAQGSSGTAVGSITNSGIADNWRAGLVSGTATVTASTVARSDGFGNNQRIVVSGASAGATVLIASATTDMPQYYTIGDWLQALAYLKASGMAGVRSIAFYINTTMGGSAYQSYCFQQNATGTAEYDQSDWEGWVSTPITRFPSGACTTMALTVLVTFGSASGAITLEVGRAAINDFGPNPSEY
jgi:lysophospholipase L1-like esterase